MIFQSIRCPEITNNEVEYEAVIESIKLAIKYGARRVLLHCESQLVVNQIAGTYQINEQRLQKYQAEIHRLMAEFDKCRFKQIPRARNIKADGLVKLVAATKNISKESVVTLLHSAIDHNELFSLNLTWDWRSHLVFYLQVGMLPSDKKEVKKLHMKLARYDLIYNELYNMAKCLGPHQTRPILEEVHDGHCGAHTGNRALVQCIIRTGYH